MSYTNELIDRYKKAINVDSDYAVAKALGLRPNRISNYRTGISHADDKTAVMLATVLHLDALETIARINMDRATDKADKAFWKRLAGSAAIVFLALSLALPAHAKPAENSAPTTQSDEAIHYAKLLIGWHDGQSETFPLGPPSRHTLAA